MQIAGCKRAWWIPRKCSDRCLTLPPNEIQDSPVSHWPSVDQKLCTELFWQLTSRNSTLCWPRPKRTQRIQLGENDLSFTKRNASFYKVTLTHTKRLSVMRYHRTVVAKSVWLRSWWRCSRSNPGETGVSSASRTPNPGSVTVVYALNMLPASKATLSAV